MIKQISILHYRRQVFGSVRTFRSSPREVGRVLVEGHEVRDDLADRLRPINQLAGNFLPENTPDVHMLELEMSIIGADESDFSRPPPEPGFVGFLTSAALKTSNSVQTESSNQQIIPNLPKDQLSMTIILFVAFLQQSTTKNDLESLYKLVPREKVDNRSRPLMNPHFDRQFFYCFAQMIEDGEQISFNSLTDMANNLIKRIGTDKTPKASRGWLAKSLDRISSKLVEFFRDQRGNLKIQLICQALLQKHYPQATQQQ